MPLPPEMLVYCVTCVDDDDQGCVFHAFSTSEKRQAFLDRDDRHHVIFDYVLDHPERMERPLS